MIGKYHMNGVTPSDNDLEALKKEAAYYSKANNRTYFIYRVIGAVTPDGTFVDASSSNFQSVK